MATKKDYLKVGDTVIWKGGFGSDAPKETIVQGIEVCHEGNKYGKPVDKVEWSKVNSRKIVVDLASGNWAYGTQLTKKTK